MPSDTPKERAKKRNKAKKSVKLAVGRGKQRPKKKTKKTWSISSYFFWNSSWSGRSYFNQAKAAFTRARYLQEPWSFMRCFFRICRPYVSWFGFSVLCGDHNAHLFRGTGDKTCFGYSQDLLGVHLYKCVWLGSLVFLLSPSNIQHRIHRTALLGCLRIDATHQEERRWF